MRRSLAQRAISPVAALAPLVALLALVVLVTCTLFLPPSAAARARVHPDPELEDAIDARVRRCVEFIYDGQLDSAEAVIEEVVALHPGDPRIGLYRFRCLRENYPDDINDEVRAKAKAPALLAQLDWSIAACDSMLEIDKRSAPAYLYRGWAHMMKAQVHAIASEIWPAGSESRRGKGDLDRYLQGAPDDVDAGVILGGYLYFADILPKVVKFLKFFARVPSGDRERGLELLAAGRESEGYTRVDSEVVLAVIEYFFEGQIEVAEGKFVELAERFPQNPRINEVLGSTAIFHPETSLRARAAQTRIIDGFGTRIRGWDDIFLYRLLYSRARVCNQMGDYDAAREDLTRIVAASPEDPFWITPRALLGLAQLSANAGEAAESHRYAERVLAEEDWSRYHPAAKRFMTLKVGKRLQEIAAGLAEVRRDLYGSEPKPETALQRIGEIRALHGDDMRLTYMEAEIHRSMGNLADARKGYELIAGDGNDGGFESTRLMSLIRLGELDLAANRFDDATKRYEEAQDIESGYTHLGNMIRGRLRFIEEASKRAD
jgi:tetratricopeptide (TPR) repeat protein